MQSEYGLIAGQEWNYDNLSINQKLQLDKAMEVGANMLYSYPVTRVNGWTIPDMRTGNFSDNYYLRAYIGLVLYAANVPQDAVYFVSEMLTNGGKVYELLFSPENGGTPPTNQFWSVTLYSDAGYLVPNEHNIYSISSQQQLNIRDDGSVHITVSMSPPADMSATNWLPSPQAGEDFQLTLRIYWPKENVLDSSWVPPAVVNLQ